MQNLFTSIIRTFVPFLVGAIVTILASKGFDVPGEFQANLASFLTFSFGAIYYIAVRTLAKLFPKLEWLLGSPVKPVYEDTKHQ